jgi:hypothetical protein
MRGKVLFITGVGVGYVLGTRAGREKFDRMVAQGRKVWESPTVQEAAGVVQAQATKLLDDGRQAVVEQMHRLHRNGKPVGLKDGEEWDATAGRTQFPANSF